MNSADLFGLQFAKRLFPQDYKKSFATQYFRENSPAEEDQKALIAFLDENNCEHFVISAAVINISQKIKIKEGDDLQWITFMPEQKAQFTFGSSFYRFRKNSTGTIHVLAGTSNNETTLYNYFIIAPEEAYQITTDTGSHDDVFRAFFLQLLIFFIIGDIEKKTLVPGQTSGNVLDKERLTNTNSSSIVLVNSATTTTIIKSGNISPEDFLVIAQSKRPPYFRQLLWNS
jgi:hypothetical protein